MHVASHTKAPSILTGKSGSKDREAELLQEHVLLAYINQGVERELII